MNNGKIRIYELSRELNLENRDIIAICEQLDIAVKSHSSTIDATHADRIRAAAKQRPASGPTKRSKGRNESARKGGPRKPQIRQILRHDPARRPDAAADSPTTAPPPSRPSKPDSPALSKPPSRGEDDVEEPATTAAVETSAPETATPPSPPPERKPASSDDGDDRDIELLTPPPRPRAPERTPAPPREERQPAKAESAAASAKPARPAPRSAAKDEPAPPVLQQKPQRPQKPGTSRPAASKQDDDTDKDELVSSSAGGDRDSVELLERPQKPRRLLDRPPSREEWVEEDDDSDSRASKGKAGKAGKTTKTATKKRRSQSVIFEEDEEELAAAGGNSAVTPAAVSLSTARPPKPNGGNQRPTPTPTPTSRPRKSPSKPDTSGGGKSDSRDRNRRDARKPQQERPESIVLSETLTVRELANLTQTPETDIIKQLFFKGIAVNITQTLDLETARAVAEELGIEVETPDKQSAATKTTEMLDDADLENLQRRPPVVTIMGHVDHGKTTLLDSIRKTKVAQGEAGGITQHIGAYHVDVEHDNQMQQVVFLDTPGHEAFTAMRARGTRVTDIAVLVVAADDGVQPQTKEAISHAKAAGVPLVVAINKVDKPEAEPDRIKQELTEQGLVPEEWGGETIMVPVSAVKGENLDTLLEMLILVSEVEDLYANPDRWAKGTVIEAHLDKARGPVATLLVQNGTLRVGDCIVAGSTLGKIRAMIDDRGERVEAASPSFAVEILGMNDVPQAGDEFDVYPSEKEARAVADDRASDRRESRLQQAMSSRRVSLSTLSAQAQEGELKELNLILKADVQGSVEAILGSLNQLPQNEVQIRVLLAAPGEVTETDVSLAAASGAVVVGFNTNLASGSGQAAEHEGVDIRQYDIIYNLLDDIQAAMEGLLEPEEVEEPLGTVEVRAVFPVGRGAVAGCYVQSGKVVRNRRIRVKRGGETIYNGVLDSLKRVKENVREVAAGYECGIGVAKFNNWQVGDIIEAYQMVMKRRTLATK